MLLKAELVEIKYKKSEETKANKWETDRKSCKRVEKIGEHQKEAKIDSR